MTTETLLKTKSGQCSESMWVDNDEFMVVPVGLPMVGFFHLAFGCLGKGTQGEKKVGFSRVEGFIRLVRPKSRAKGVHSID